MILMLFGLKSTKPQHRGWTIVQRLIRGAPRSGEPLFGGMDLAICLPNRLAKKILNLPIQTAQFIISPLLQGLVEARVNSEQKCLSFTQLSCTAFRYSPPVGYAGHCREQPADY